MPPSPTGTFRLAAMALLAGLGAFAHATCPSWPTAERFEFLTGGADVLDKRTGLVWARCSAGQVWVDGDCTGATTDFTQQSALAYAATQGGWRLPNRRELASLADIGCISPAIDVVAFPSTPGSYYWSSTPYVDVASYAWNVRFYNGYVNRDHDRNSSFAVRLVRASR